MYFPSPPSSFYSHFPSLPFPSLPFLIPALPISFLLLSFKFPFLITSFPFFPFPYTVTGLHCTLSSFPVLLSSPSPSYFYFHFSFFYTNWTYLRHIPSSPAFPSAPTSVYIPSSRLRVPVSTLSLLPLSYILDTFKRGEVSRRLYLNKILPLPFFVFFSPFPNFGENKNFHQNLLVLVHLFKPMSNVDVFLPKGQRTALRYLKKAFDKSPALKKQSLNPR